MSLTDAFAPIEAHYRAQVEKDIWGHFAPQKNVKYKGYVIFSVGCFGSDPLNPTVLHFYLLGGGKGKGAKILESSPWFHGALMDFLRKLKAEIGRVYKWEGSFRNYEFDGTVREMKLS